MAGFDETFDWVVVGSGAGSMSSALVMRQARKSAVILEKTPFVGGTTAKSGGTMWIPNNRFIKAEDPTETPEKAMTYLDAVTNDGSDAPGTSRENRLAYVTEAPKMLEFIMGKGIVVEKSTDFWPDYYDELPGGCKTTRCVNAKYFNLKELGPVWSQRLRKGFVEAPARLGEGMKLPFAHRSWKLKLLMVRIGFRIIGEKLTGKHFATAGAALQGRMLQAALAAGVDIRIETPVKELIVEDGAVTGVVAEVNGKLTRIGARLGVLVNAGGFAQNQAMRDKYQPGTRTEWSNVPEGDTGDMHVELERIGGVLAQMNQMVGFQMTRMPGWEGAYVKPGTQSSTAKPHAIQVDQSGVRYMNEGGSYELFCQTMLERNRVVSAVPSWGIVDIQFMEKFALAGVGSPLKKVDGWLKSGWLKRGDTIEELAAQINVPPATLRATVDRWNASCDKGHDEDFHRGDRAYDQWLGDMLAEGIDKCLGRIDKGPFYAFDVVPGDVSTYGGALIDASARIIRPDGAPIAGLYACGVSTASIMGGVYPGAGASVGPSMTFGFIAAKHAAGVDNQF
jgi:3-oxosteroid 1-dehydrogenase